eukprot:TRINITY_DN11822_c0_g1_i2.p1 TRINITY_DN11822_c0_g1~~TRINITY_DN11822_c0_g1_i2.p1  ORF type:complete len:495 (-),score=94.97 TRINITY_DN11822_c0_g1_i2:97-1581(-)
MPPLPVSVRAVLDGALKGSPVEIQYLSRNRSSNVVHAIAPSALGSKSVTGNNTVPVSPEAAELAALVLQRPDEAAEAPARQQQSGVNSQSSEVTKVAENSILSAGLLEEPESPAPALALAGSIGSLLVKNLDAAPALATPAPDTNALWQDCLPAMLGLMGCIAVAAFIYFMLHRLQQNMNNMKACSGLPGVAKREKYNRNMSPADLVARAKLNQDKPNQLGTGQEAPPVAESSAPVLGDRCRTTFPTVCPPYMRAEQGATLFVPLECDVKQDWSSSVTGLAAGMAVRGPEVAMLAVAVRWTFPETGAAAERVLEIRERQPGGDASELGINRIPAGRVLLTVTSRGELWLAPHDSSGASEEQQGLCLGRLQPQAQLGSAQGVGSGRRMFCWERRELPGKAQEADEHFGNGLPTLAVIIGKKGIELGEMPSGKLVATAVYSEAGSPKSAALRAPSAKTLKTLKVSVKPGIDAALALGCILGVSLLQASPEVETPTR